MKFESHWPKGSGGVSFQKLIVDDGQRTLTDHNCSPCISILSLYISFFFFFFFFFNYFFLGFHVQNSCHLDFFS